MIDLYTCKTANGYRASIALEEAGLAYRAHDVDLPAGAHRTPEFLRINPLGRVPALVDDDGEDGAPFALAETLAIAAYAAERSGRLMPADVRERALAWQWGATIVSGFGSALPGIFFGRQIDAVAHAGLIDKYFKDIDAYLAAMDGRLAANEYLAGSAYSIADVLAIPTILSSLPRFGVDVARFEHVVRWRDLVAVRPAVAKGMAVPGG